MELRAAFSAALKQARTARGLTQESFSDVSSRTYMSALERGIRAPTIEKLEELCEVMGIHMLSILALSYLKADPTLTIQDLLTQVKLDVQEMQIATE